MSEKFAVPAGFSLVTIDASRFTGSSAHEYKIKLEELISCGYRKIIFDLSRVEYIDSMGLSVFLSAIKSAGEDGEFIITGVNAGIARIFALTRLDRIFKVKPAGNHN